MRRHVSVEQRRRVDAARGLELDAEAEQIGASAKFLTHVARDARGGRNDLLAGLGRCREHERLRGQLHRSEVDGRTFRDTGDETLLLDLLGDQYGDHGIVEIDRASAALGLGRLEPQAELLGRFPGAPADAEGFLSVLRSVQRSANISLALHVPEAILHSAPAFADRPSHDCDRGCGKGEDQMNLGNRT